MPVPAPVLPLPEPIARLKSARDEAKAKTHQPAPDAPLPAPSAKVETPKPAEAPKPAEPTPEGGYLGRLLDAKKRAKGDK